MKNKEYRNEGLDFKRLTLFFKKRIWIVLLMAVLGGIIGAVGYQVTKSMYMPIEYKAESKIYIKFLADPTGEVYQSYNGYTWNDIIRSDMMMDYCMVFLPGYKEENVRESLEADILSDLRLLTVTVTTSDEKSAREIQGAIEDALTMFAYNSTEVESVTTITTKAPERVYWKDKTAPSLVAGALILGFLTLIMYLILYITDDAIYVQSDINKRYDYRALGIMPRAQKGLQPYAQELKANIMYALKDNKSFMFLDLDEHSSLRAQDFEKLFNWQEGGVMEGLENGAGSLTWHVKEAEEYEDLFSREEEKEWNIIPMDSEKVDALVCSKIRELGGVFILVPFGSKAAPRKLERTLSFINNQNLEVLGIIISEADEEYLTRYYS